MLTYHLGTDDLARVRLAISPMGETSLSLWSLVLGPRGRPHVSAWHQNAVARRDEYDFALLTALVSPSGFSLPDFINPPLQTTRPSLDDEYELIANTPADLVVRDLTSVCDGLEPRPEIAALLDDPAHAGRSVADALRRYHDVVIAPYWSKIARVLESDITFRGREFGQRGVAGLFDGLTEGIRWLDDGTIEVIMSCDREDESHGSGDGVVLTPSVFTRRAVSWRYAECTQPWVSYPARGAGLLMGSPAVVRNGALCDLVGGPKSDILCALTEPASTSELAHRFSVTPSAVSQNLRVLGDNGLVESSRHGREVLYRLSDTGRRLVDGAGRGVVGERVSGRLRA